eukprot:gene52812-64533_t
MESISDRSEVFGGERNVNKSVFVFDAKWSPHDQGVMAVAASDATVRILDVRVEDNEQSLVLDLQRNAAMKLGHTTSVNWSSDGQLLSVSFGSGCVALFDIRQDARCLGIHQVHSRACYGSSFVTHAGHPCVMSYASDATLKIRNVEAYTSSSAAPQAAAVDVACPVQELSEVLVGCAHPGGKVICGGSCANKSFMGTPILVIDPLLFGSAGRSGQGSEIGVV